MTHKKTALIHSKELEGYSYPEGCPFSTLRAGRAREVMASMGLLSGPNREEREPKAASRELIETFHSPKYIDAMIKAPQGHLDVEGLSMGLGTPDCPVFKGMYEYAALACGATMTAAEMVASQQAHVAFNPSGGYHHAGPDYASGFCYVNDIVITCMMLAKKVDRVLFLDVDAHHGDGVQNAFYDRRDVMTISFHESGKTLFPGTGFESEVGKGDGLGYCVNVPLPPETYDEAYLKAFRQIAPPLIGAFAPDIILMELGMDCLSGDPLTNLSLTNNTYADVIELVLRANKPIVATGGGGYHVENTVRGYALAWAVLCGEEDHHSPAHGMGGVMLESTDWLGGLRDRMLAPDEEQRNAVDTALDATVEIVKEEVFPLHGL